MAVQTKYRRKIILDGRQYVWYVKKDDDFCGRHILHIISSDKKLILAFPLDTEIFYVVSKGKVFQNTAPDGCWKRYAVPIKKALPVTPKLVSQLIDWALNGTDATGVEFNDMENLL